MSPARMYSLAAPIDALYAAGVTVRAASAFCSPAGGAATSGGGPEPSPGRAQSAASSTSRAQAAS